MKRKDLWLIGGAFAFFVVLFVACADPEGVKREAERPVPEPGHFHRRTIDFGDHHVDFELVTMQKDGASFEFCFSTQRVMGDTLVSSVPMDLCR